MISSIVSRLVILLFGTLYPAYASYKAVRTKDVREYVKWMMYWIVFALFTCAETFTDVLLSFWFPFYYELKIIVVLWLLSPATRGSSILYRKFVHPTLTKREKEIDEAIMHAKAQGYTTILRLGARGVDYAKYVIMQTAIKGGGGLMNQLKKSYSLSDLSDNHDDFKLRAIRLGSLQEEHDVTDHLRDQRLVRRSIVYPDQRPGSVSGPLEMYFSEVDLDLKQRGRAERPSVIGLPQSLEDVSSGYSSADPLFNASQGNSPTTDHALEEIFLRSSSTGSTNVKSRRPIYSGNMMSNKSSEAASSVMGKLDTSLGETTPPTFLSPSMLTELRNLLTSRTGDINKFLVPCTSNLNPADIKVSDSIVTRMLPLKQNREIDDTSLKPLENECLPEVSIESNIPLKTQNSDRPELSTSDEMSDNVQDSKEKATRAGRYKKLRAPGPPNKSTSNSESMSDSEHGTVVRARMSLVSSRKMSGSVNILVESKAGIPAAEHGTKPTTMLLSRRKSSRNELWSPSLLLKRKMCNNISLSLPNLHNIPYSLRPTTLPRPLPATNTKIFKIRK
ncbi:hypothetical protein ONE63_003120 [Megalurothrips usitatus]|uniref:Receptor expression-enhancing protein n=1 Tax=Megalurothrips usitatus TaxID=439358 RepID=A0AAV7XAR0_9NEOP|nr:hypothetical protein ONE63_003120 [Megalurothrips usitatus]